MSNALTLTLFALASTLFFTFLAVGSLFDLVTIPDMRLAEFESRVQRFALQIFGFAFSLAAFYMLHNAL